VSRATLQPREAATEPAAIRRLAGRTPVQYLVFDLIWCDGQSTVDIPYRERRDLLGALDLNGAHWQFPPHFTGGGSFARETARAQGTGVVAKRLDSVYLPGQRGRQWLEIG
jgi:bifunctional non-homologous end joining protein LigD